MAKNCACCQEHGEEFVVLMCKHYVCLRCGKNFREGKNKYFTHRHNSVNVECKICDKGEKVSTIRLTCGHRVNANCIRTYGYPGKELFSCGKCNCQLNDVELYAMLGKEKANNELDKINNLMKSVIKQNVNRKKFKEDSHS